jgi:hypothetical protein
MSQLRLTLRAEGYEVTTDAIYKWIAGRHEPRPSHARAIERISHRTATPVTFQQVYDHVAEVRTQPAQPRTADRTSPR